MSFVKWFAIAIAGVVLLLWAALNIEVVALEHGHYHWPIPATPNSIAFHNPKTGENARCVREKGAPHGAFLTAAMQRCQAGLLRKGFVQPPADFCDFETPLACVL